jgi:hypothetical protein
MSASRRLAAASLTVSLLSMGSGVFAQNHNDQGGSGADVFAITACWSPNCFMTSTSFGYPNPVAYTDLATLTLPAGHYLLHGKLSAYTNSPINWANLECYMGTEKDRPTDWWNFTDYASVSYNGEGQQHVTSMVLAIRLTAPKTILGIGCKLAGFNYSQGYQAPVQLGVWGVRLVAERVGSTVQRIVP